MKNTLHPHRDRHIVRGVRLVALAAAIGTGIPAVAGQPTQNAALAVVRTSVLEPTIPSGFGDLQYDNSPNCGGPLAEVAYVANRVIVQTNQSPATVSGWIDAWIAPSPPSSPARANRTSTRSLRAPIGSSLPTTTRAVDSIVFPTIDDGEPPIRPVYAFELPVGGAYDVVGLARHLVNEFGVAAAPDYVTMLQGGHDFFQPDGLPQPTSELPVSRKPFKKGGPELGAGTRIMVFDSGLAATTEPALIPNVTAVLPADVEIPDRQVPGLADNLWVDHGLAISAHIATLVPGAIVENARITRDGVSTDFTSAKRMVTTISGSATNLWPNLLVASFGTMACELDPALPGDELVPVSLRAASEAVQRLSPRRPGEMAIIAAAGNHGTQRREYPAGFPGVISVGALDATLDADGGPITSTSRTGPVAGFSARGSWVDFYAPGVDIVTLHADDITFESFDEQGVLVESVLIEGRAKVQGTSFATPHVAASLAELMSTHHISVWDASVLLGRSGAKPQVPCDGSATRADLGPGKAVALVDLTLPSDTKATGPVTKVC